MSHYTPSVVRHDLIAISISITALLFVVLLTRGLMGSCDPQGLLLSQLQLLLPLLTFLLFHALNRLFDKLRL